MEYDFAMYDEESDELLNEQSSHEGQAAVNNLLDKFDYIEVNLVNKNELEVIYKLKIEKIIFFSYELSMCMK